MTPEEEREGAEINVQPRRLSVRLRPLMPEIDRLVREGVTHDDVVAGLAERGIGVSLGTFRKNLYRYRRKAAAKPAAPMIEASPLPRPEPIGGAGDQISALPTSVESEKSPAPMGLSFAEAMKPEKRDAFAEQFVTSPRRRIGQKKDQD
jgi:hypothetical protein